jgi:hypothetical protein
MSPLLTPITVTRPHRESHRLLRFVFRGEIRNIEGLLSINRLTYGSRGLVIMLCLGRFAWQ